jgi:ABC-type taurine transport system substrate-binding protein
MTEAFSKAKVTTAFWRKASFFSERSIIRTLRPGKITFSGIAGNPPPVPMSNKVPFAFSRRSTIGARLNESTKWARTRFGRSFLETSEA